MNDGMQPLLRLKFEKCGPGCYAATLYCKGPYGPIPFGGRASTSDEERVSGDDDPELSEESEYEASPEEEEQQDAEEEASQPGQSASPTIIIMKEKSKKEKRKAAKAKRRAARRAMRRARQAAVMGAVDIDPNAKRALKLTDDALKLYRLYRQGRRDARDLLIGMLKSSDLVERKAAEAAVKMNQ